MTTVFIITIYFYNTVYVDNSIFSTHVRLPKVKNAKILYSITNILPVLFPLYRGPQNSFPNHEESSWAGGGGHPRLNGQPLAATGALDVSSNGGSGGFSYSADATVKLALNGVRKRPVRSGAIKVDLSCADKSIRRDSAPDLIRKETETNQYLGSFVLDQDDHFLATYFQYLLQFILCSSRGLFRSEYDSNWEDELL